MDTRVLVFLLLAVVTVSRCRAEMGILEASLKAGYQAFTQCQNEDDSLTCLKLRALRFVDRANLVSRIPMTDGLSLVRVESDERSMDEDNEIIPEVDRQLPTDLEQRSEYLDELLSKRINRFFKLHQLEFGFPKNVYEEGQQFIFILFIISLRGLIYKNNYSCKTFNKFIIFIKKSNFIFNNEIMTFNLNTNVLTKIINLSNPKQEMVIFYF